MKIKKIILGKGKVSSVITDKESVVLDKKQCNILNINDLNNVINKYKPEIIINCAAKTNLEYCQENKIDCFESNTRGVLNLIEICSLKKIKLVHISSGCLFDGNEFIANEKTHVSPKVWYTWTKAWADQIIENYGYENYLILRPRQLISCKPHPTNMLTKFSKMKKIPAIKEPNSITCLEDFKEIINHLIKIDAVGIYNCANEGVVTPYDIAIGVKEKINPSLVVVKETYENLLKQLPNRRVNTILSITKLKNSGYTPRSAKDALNWCLENYGK